MDTRVAMMSAPPAVSEKTAVNVCDRPLPEFGVTEIGIGNETAVAVQDPIRLHPPNAVAFCASRKMLFWPWNAGRKFTTTVSVSVLPEATTDEAPGLTLHWLFDRLPEVPAGTPV